MSNFVEPAFRAGVKMISRRSTRHHRLFGKTRLPYTSTQRDAEITRRLNVIYKKKSGSLLDSAFTKIQLDILIEQGFDLSLQN